MRKLIIGIFAVMAAVGQAQLMAGEVDYNAGDTKAQGYLAYDSGKTGKRPAVLIVHDWNSIDKYEQGRAVQLAKLGYVAFCADIYGKDSRPTNRQENAAQAGKYKGDRKLFRERLQAALDFLKKDPNVDPDRIVAIGYCFGGTGVLEMARAQMPVKGVVSFHGGLDAGKGFEATSVGVKVLICHGADDPAVPPAQVDGFMDEFKKAGASVDFVAYPGAVHSFTEPNAGNDPSKGSAYNKAADEASWIKLVDFLKTTFA